MADLSFHTRWRMFLAKSRSGLHSLDEAWRHLVGAKLHRDIGPDVLHPDPRPSICTCYGEQRAGREPYDDHDPSCPWLASRCGECFGSGCCLVCGGDGIHPIQEGAEVTGFIRSRKARR